MDEFNFNDNIIKAVAGNAEAQYIVGMCYLLQQGVKRNYKEAFTWISKSAEQDNVDAIHMLGEFYKSGTYVSENYEMALTYYHRAAKLGAPASQNEVGINCARHGDFEQALSYFFRAAEKDYAPAMTNIARIYLDGLGNINKDKLKAIEYLEKASTFDDDEALNILGCIYLEGNGIPKNSKEAIKLFKKAAKLDNPYAKLNLANLYEEGEELPLNIEKAIELWYEISDIVEDGYKKIQKYAKKGVASAQYYYSDFFDEKNEALKWLKKSADNGFAAAQYEIGIYYRDGINIEKNYEKAKFYLTEASKQYYEGAAFALNVLETISPKKVLIAEPELEEQIDSIECHTKDLKNYVLEKESNFNSVISLKLIGKVGPNSLKEGGSVNNWLENLNFNGKFILDLTDAEGLSYIPNNAFYIAPFRRCNIKLKAVYLPNTVTDIGSCAFTNQEYLSEIKYSNHMINFQSNCLEGTSITELKFPESYYFWRNSVTWSNLETIIFPPNFISEPPVQPDFPSKNSERFNNWDLFINNCSNLKKIIIPIKEKELSEKQLDFINFLRKKRKEIQLEIS